MKHPLAVGRTAPRLMPAVALLVLSLLLPRFASAEAFDRKDLRRIESRVQSVAEHAMPTIVALTHRVGIGTASGTGTVVSKDGLILTAAHVVANTEAVDVTFPDGTTRTAKVLGGDATRDVALVRIKEPGEYAFAEMGHSKKLKAGDLVVAMGHPGGFDQARKPPVRFGRILSANPQGYLRSDCTLISGDSGGPLFDLDGKVIGVHSSIGVDVTVNNHVPVDVARDDWDRLLAGERWGVPLGRPLRPRPVGPATRPATNPTTKPTNAANPTTNPTNPTAAALPATRPAGGLVARGLPADLNVEKLRKSLAAEAQKSDGRLNVTPERMAAWLKGAGMDPAKVDEMTPAELAALTLKALGGDPRAAAMGRQSAESKRAIEAEDRAILATERPDLEKVKPAVVTLLDGNDGDRVLCLGTVIRADGFALTKRSEIAKAKSGLKVRLADGRSFPCKSVREFAEHDLAIVHFDADDLAAVSFSAGPALRAGSFVAAPGVSPDDLMLGLGVVSVPSRSLRESGGFLGVGLAESNGAAKIGMVAPGSPADKAGLHKDDVLEAINDTPIKHPADLSRTVRALKPGSVASVKYHRGDNPSQTARVVLGDRADLPAPKATPMAKRLGGGISDVHTGFPSVLQHDQPLRPEDCGGPLIDLRGQVVGFNIARAGRIETYAIPAGTIADLLKGVDLDKLVH